MATDRANMDSNAPSPYPEGVVSLLDTDLYKLTMQCAVFKWFRDVPVTYAFTNRTPDMKFSRTAYRWLKDQIHRLGNISLSTAEYRYLQRSCRYLDPAYLSFLREFRLRPRDQVRMSFAPSGTGADGSEVGDVAIDITGTWLGTILYEIPMLSLTSEAYFRFMDTDWNYDGQEALAYAKGAALLEAGCLFSEFGTRRRRDYHTQALVLGGLVRASREGRAKGFPGKLVGTSNVHLAMCLDMAPVGTVAHEWYMGIAAIIDDYHKATEVSLRHWIATFGNELSISLTDTFGTPEFLRAFAQPVGVLEGGVVAAGDVAGKTYAQYFTGVRQDSGDPSEFVRVMRDYYDGANVAGKKTLVFSDALDVDKCLEYKRIAEAAHFQPSFGVGTFLTNDFARRATGAKSTPLNIVVKLSSACGRPAVKISDNIGKNTGDKATVDRVKKDLGYVEKEWEGGDESARWREDAAAK